MSLAVPKRRERGGRAFSSLCSIRASYARIYGNGEDKNQKADQNRCLDFTWNDVLPSDFFRRLTLTVTTELGYSFSLLGKGCRSEVSELDAPSA